MSYPVLMEEIIATRPFGWTFTESNKTMSSFSFEQWNLLDMHEMVSSNWKLSVYAGVAYILVIFGIQWWMKGRKPFELKRPLFWWNFGLGVFSIIGFARTLPGFLNVLGEENGFYQSICSKSHMDIPTTYWMTLFAMSKFVELGDTLFIVLRRRPLIFLQWYHHLVTMNVTWILAPLLEPIVIRWYTTLNYGVHSLMYPYFAARALGVPVPRYVANVITTLQFAQMIIGFTVNMMSMVYQRLGYDCARYPISIQLFSMVYGSFLFLFGKLFYDSVIKKGRIQKDKLGKKED